MKSFYKNKRILITGAAGTIGKEIAHQVYNLNPAEMRLLDNNESETFYLAEKFKQDNVVCYLGDIRDRDKLEKVSIGIDILIHCAAFKHVILSEYNPFDAVQTNIIGVENIISAAVVNRIKHVILTSSDKAVNPTNVMGTTKLMGEKLMTAANAIKSSARTVFSSTRFGNVVGSRGSVVPIFMRQIKDGGPVTITDERMTRFIMSINEAARLVITSATIARGGEVFVTKMPIVRIIDLAAVMIELLAPKYGYKPRDIKIAKIGVKPGEKMYEELLSEEEKKRSLELKNMFVITPAFRSIYRSISYQYTGLVSERVIKSYVSTSEQAMTKAAIKAYLLKHKVLELVGEGI